MYLYTSVTLAFESDKLIAISGLAVSIQAETGDGYVIGL